MTAGSLLARSAQPGYAERAAAVPPWMSGTVLRRAARVQAWFVRRPLVLDVLTALAVTGALVLADLVDTARPPRTVWWDLLLAAPLVLRRRHPAVAGFLVAGGCLAQWLFWMPILGDGAVLLVLYSLGAYELRRRVLWAAIAVAELGVIMAVVRWGAVTNQVLSTITMTGTVTAAWVLGIYVNVRRSYLASIRERAETAERERDSRAQVAVAAERARLAREMHDVIAHGLSVMITLNDAAAAVEPAPQVRETIAQASEVGRQALAEMHRMLGVLRDGEQASYAPQPGLADLPALVSMVRSAGLAVEFAASGDLAGVAPTAQLAVYRIVQESLTNVLKHARNVEQVVVEVAREADRLTLRIDDDGAPEPDPSHLSLGHPPPGHLSPEHLSPGHGLGGMAERARLFGGRLEAGPRPAGGWSVRARLECGPSAVRL
ncbi:MAG TPA: histidine kinase [Actinocrinis sp.]|nr:histidine kinase [Actinocrinis sp.]